MADSEKTKQVRVYHAGHGREPLLVEYEASVTRQRRARRFQNFTVLSLLLILALHVWFKHTNTSTMETVEASTPVEDGLGGAFDWFKIHPTTKLKWHECYGKLECSRLAVPLDYSEPHDRKAAVALVKLPSKYPHDHEEYRGPLLLNPGGPGGSGVSLVVLAGDALRMIIGDEYDIVGFDPRGVGLTTPSLRTFKDQVEVGAFYSQNSINVNASVDALGNGYARSLILGKLVEERMNHTAQHVSTPVVARDMLSIVKAYGRDKLQYWGFSYGTVLGATFAAMFPDNIERLVIDGVVDSEDYYQGGWSNNLRDADNTLAYIYESCVEAGPSQCPLYEKTASQIAARVTRILDVLKTVPMPHGPQTMPGSPYEEYGVIDYSTAKSLLFAALYTPYIMGPMVLRALEALERGDTSMIWGLSTGRALQNLLHCDCPLGAPQLVAGGPEVTFAIACGDGDEVTDGIPELREYYEKMAQGSIFADGWTVRTGCAGWKVRPKERFDGTFTQNTSHPILLIGNTADPVTPLWNARKMSKGFKDSVVLTQDSAGHCSVSAVSICTIQTIREYFRNGTLPEAGTVCKVMGSIFPDDKFYEQLSAEDRMTFDATMKLNKFLSSTRNEHRLPL